MRLHDAHVFAAEFKYEPGEVRTGGLYDLAAGRKRSDIRFYSIGDRK